MSVPYQCPRCGNDGLIEKPEPPPRVLVVRCFSCGHQHLVEHEPRPCEPCPPGSYWTGDVLEAERARTG